MRPLTQTEFVNKATERAKRPVDLSGFTYSGCAVKSTAICPDHGEFQITPNALMNRIGCPACALIERAAKRRMDHATFIEKSIAVHRGHLRVWACKLLRFSERCDNNLQGSW